MRTKLSLVLLAGLASTALADIPSALDRVPLDTPLIVAMDKASAAKETVAKLSRLIEGPSLGGMEEATLMGPINELLSLPGLAPDGSVAVLIYPKKEDPKDDQKSDLKEDSKNAKPDATKDSDDEFFDEDAGSEAEDAGELMDEFDIIALVPVSSAKEFAGGLGVVLESGKGSTAAEGQQLHLRDIGSGHVAISTSQSTLDAFQPAEKQLAAHTAAIGKVGEAIAKNDHMIVIANVALMQGVVAEYMEDASRDAGSEMGMPGMGQMLPMSASMLKDITKDATRVIMGTGTDDAGIWMDMGVQYKEGTPSAATMNVAGNTGALTAKLPAKPFLLAGAFDMSSPAMKQLVSGFLGGTAAAMGANDADNGAKNNDEKAFSSPFSMIAELPDLADGWSVVIGENPAGMQTGVLTQSVYVVQTSDPGKYLAKMEEWNTATNGLNVDGVTYKSKYAKGAEEVGGVKADTWEVQTLPDKDNPNAMMMNMSQGVLFGGPRMRGYAAAAGNNVVMTMSRNKTNFAAAIAAAKGEAEDGKTLADNKDIQHAASFLPQGRAMEAFINPRPLLEAASGMMEQFGMPGFDIPERVSAVGIGAAMQGGGMHARVYIPSDVLLAIESIAKSMEDAEADLMAPMDEGGDEAPRF
ncbi:MAG TPA: hypothetical protein VHN77_02745 [Phycisphaerales bacterium]|nr:hypothetical protein [Phycisphaerales bacterium]